MLRLARAVSPLFYTLPGRSADNVCWLHGLPGCAAEPVSRLNISVISFPAAIKSLQTARVKRNGLIIGIICQIK